MEDIPNSTCRHISPGSNANTSLSLCTECINLVSQLQISPLQSPLQHLLSESIRHVPSVSEEVQIREIIGDAERRLAEIDTARGRIAQLLGELDQERIVVQEYAYNHRVMVAPIWYVPPEIISCIFTFCLPRDSPQEITRSSIKSSLLVSAVDRNWRNIALSTPQLWTTMFLDDNSFSPDSTYMPKIFLDRSGDLPLSLYVHAKGYPSPPSFIAYATSLSGRWQHIILDAQMSNLVPILSASNSPNYPFLQNLELQVPGWEGENPNIFSNFTNAPLLQHVTTSATFYPSFRVLPWKQLRTWDSVVPLQDFPLIFEWAPYLETCFIQPSRLAPGQHILESSCATAAKLTYLHISTGLVTNTSIQLHHLPSFPALRRLFLYFDKRVPVASPDITLIPLFLRSGALLEHLTIALTISSETLRKCLTHTPTLTTLQIHRVTTNFMLEFLAETPNENDVFLIPGLVNLRLSGKICFSARSVINVINTRWARSFDTMEEALNDEGTPTVAVYPRALKSVHILPPRQDRFDLASKKELLAFREKGLDVEISQLDRNAFLRHVT